MSDQNGCRVGQGSAERSGAELFDGAIHFAEFERSEQDQRKTNVAALKETPFDRTVCGGVFDGVILKPLCAAEEGLERERARARRRDVEDRIASALWRCVDEAMDAREDFAIALDESGGPVIPARTRSLRAPLSLGDIQEREVVLIYMGSGDDL